MHINLPELGQTFARNLMPQIDDQDKFLTHLKTQGIDVEKKILDTKNLKATQLEFDFDKIKEIITSGKKSKPILVSTDGHVLDGHHRWIADHNMSGKTTAYVIDQPILELRAKAQTFNGNMQEELTHKEFHPMLHSFASYVSNKLGIKEMPDINYKSDSDEFKSFGAYNPSSKSIVLQTKNRHPMDIYRTLAHELMHHKQNEDGKIKDPSNEGSTGSDIENEANAQAGILMRHFAKKNPGAFKLSSLIEDSHINNKKEKQMKDKGKKWNRKKVTDSNFHNLVNEGIDDPAILKAVFMAGGPGSGKDFIMNRTTSGMGFTEINSDNILEYLMKKRGLSLMMPSSEEGERDVVRGKAKTLTSEKQKLALMGRKGLIINGTGDDPKKILTIKKELESLGYDTMMLFVNTSNEVSQKRNFERGVRGGRKVPDGTDNQGNPDGSKDIRGEKWKAAQIAKSDLQKIFGQDAFIEFDNSADTFSMSDAQKRIVRNQLDEIWKKIKKFSVAPHANEKATPWLQTQKFKTTSYAPAVRSFSFGDPRKTVTNTNKEDPSIMDQAKRMGLSYYGFGRYGRNIAGSNKVTHIVSAGKLMQVSQGQHVPLPKSKNPMRARTLHEGKKKLVRKKLSQEQKLPSALTGLPEIPDGVGPEVHVPRVPGLPSSSIYESIKIWSNKESTKERFKNKYGDLAKKRLDEARAKLENSVVNEAWDAVAGVEKSPIENSHNRDELDEDSRLQKVGVTGFNKPKRTPGHPTKSHVVVAKQGNKIKVIRFGEQGAETAGAPKEGESERMKRKRASFKARHRKNINKGKMSAAYWANKEKW